MVSVKNLFHKITKLELLKILWNSKKALIIYSFFIFGNIFATYYYSLNTAFFVGLLATATSIFVSYLTIKNTNELDFKKTQREVFFRFVDELMTIVNYNNKDYPQTIDKFNPHKFIKNSSEPKEVSPVTFTLVMDNTFNDTNIHTQLNKYFIKLINSPKEFYYIPMDLQTKIKKYVYEYRIIHESYYDILNQIAEDNIGKFENFNTWDNIPKGSNNFIAKKTITNNPHISPDFIKHFGNFLIIRDIQIPEKSDEYKDEFPDFNDKYYEVYIMKINETLITKLNLLAQVIYIETSEKLSTHIKV